MALIWLWLQTYLSVAAVLLVAYAAGRPLVRRAFEGAVVAPLSVLTGAGLLSLAVCLLSWAHAFTRGALAVVAATAVVTALSDHLRAGGGGLPALPPWRPRLDARLVFGLIVVAAGVAFTILTLYPPGSAIPPPFGDDTSYHLPLAQSLVDHHGFHDEPSIRLWFFPLGNEALMAIGLMAFGDDRVPAALELALLFATCWTLWAYFASAGGEGRRAGWASALVLLGSPLVVATSAVAFVDTWTLAYAAAAMVALALLLEERGRKSPLLAGALAGFLVAQCAAAKYTGLIVGAAIVALALPLVRHGRLGRVALGAGAVGAALVLAPWYLRTAHLTGGNPVYPYLHSILGGSPEITTLGQAPLGGAAVPSAAPNARGIFFYLRHDLAVFIPGMNPGHGYPNALALTPLLGLAYLGLASRALTRRVAFLAVLAVATLFFAVWATHSADPRYAMPVVGLWALGAGFAAARLHAAVEADIHPRARALMGPVLALAILAPSLYVVLPALRDRGSPPTDTGARYRYLVGNVPCYAGLAHLNQRFGSRYGALGLDCQKARHYARGRLIDVRRPKRLRLATGRCPEVVAPDLVARLRALGVGYVVSSAYRRPSGARAGPCPGLQAALESSKELRLEFDSDGSRVYRIVA